MGEKLSKKKIVFSEEDKTDIINKYKSGLSGEKISKEYLCSEITIRRLLRRNNITAKDNPNNIFIKDLPEEDRKFIINSYLNGVSAEEIGKKYNCNEGAISNFLKKNNIKYKDAKHYHRKDFNEFQINDIIDKYKIGVSIVDLTKEYNCNQKTINNLIPPDIKAQFKIYRNNKNKYRKYIEITSNEKEEIKDKYLSGIFQKELGNQYNLSIESIKCVLREFNLSGKDNPNWDKEKKKFKIEMKKEIVDLYKNGHIQDELANIFDCSRDYIREILYEYDCSYKDNTNYYHNISETLENEIDNIINLYDEGISASKLAEKYKVGQKVIANILKDKDIYIRKPSEYYNYTDEEMLNFLKEIYDEYGYVNTVLLNTLEGYPTSCTYKNRFGLFKNAMEKADLPYITSIIMLDDEICKSGFEYRLSIVLRKYNIKYDRDYLYKNIIPNYNKNHSIDYKINYDNDIFYIEVFGMSGSTYTNRKYDETKEMKIKLCKENNIPMIYLYPKDFKLVNKKFEEHILSKIKNIIKN